MCRTDELWKCKGSDKRSKGESSMPITPQGANLKEVKAALIKMDEWFSDESKWCKKTLCRDRFGIAINYPITQKQSIAQCCIIGSLIVITDQVETKVRRDCEDILRDQLPPKYKKSVADFNDNVTFQEIKALIRKAIEVC